MYDNYTLDFTDPGCHTGIELSIVFPSYQEEENLRLLLPRTIKTLKELDVSWEVLVIDTVKPLDGTPQLCDELGVSYVSRKEENNFGDAVRTGIHACRGRLVVFMDADGSHSPEWISRLYENRHGNDVVIASRYIVDGNTENSQSLVFLSRVLNWTYSIVLGIRCRDISNSYRLYDGDQLRALTLRCNNFDIVEEILFKLIRNKKAFKIKEIPFTFKQRLFGQTKRRLMLFVVTYCYTLIKLRFLI